MYEVKPTIPIKKLIEENNNSVAKPINPNEMVNNIEHKQTLKRDTEDFTEYEDDLYFKSLIDGEKEMEEKPRKKTIDIVINGKGDSPAETLLDFMFDFEDITTMDESMENKIERKHIPEKIRQIQMPANFNPSRNSKRPLMNVNKI